MESLLILEDLLQEGCVTSSAVEKINEDLLNKVSKELSIYIESDDKDLSDLQSILQALQNLVRHDSSSFDHLKEQGILVIMKVIFDKVIVRISREGASENLQMIIELSTETAIAMADVSSKAKGAVIEELSPCFLDLLQHQSLGFQTRMEVLKSTNILLEQCPTTVKEHFLGSEELGKKISELVNLVKTIGDYEFQVGLIECLMRLFPRKSRQIYAEKFFSDPDMLDGFLAIKDKDFETDCRLFLNSVNAKAEDPSKGVFSLPCVTAFVGSKQLRKPSDAGYEEFWVDFNFGSERLTLFCEQDSIYSQSTFDEELWETVAIYKTDVQQCSYNELPGLLELEVSLKHPVCDLYPSQHQDVQDNKIKIHFNPELEAHVTHAVGYTFDFSERRCKASTVQTPLQISLNEVKQVDSQSESMYDCHLPNPPSPVRSGSQESVSRKRKVSIPTVPMQNPAASPMLKPNNRAQKYVPSENASVADSQPKPQTNIAADRFLKVSESIKEITGKKNSQSNQCEKHVESKKDFAVPTTPVKKTRSRVKVKTPVVTVTPPAKKSKENTAVAMTSEQENQIKHSDVCEPDDVFAGVCEPDEVIPDSLPPVEENTEVYTAKKVKASKSADHLDDSGIGIDESRSTINNTSVTSELDHCDQPNAQKEDMDLTGAAKVVDNTMAVEKQKKLTRDKNKDKIKDHCFETVQVCKKDDTSSTSGICKVNNFKKKASEHKPVEDHSFGFESLCVDGTVDSIPDSYESEQAMNNAAVTDQNPKLDKSDCNNKNKVTKKTGSKTNKKTKHTEKQVKNKVSTEEVSDKSQMVKTKDTPEIASATEHSENKRTFTDVDQSLRELCDLEDKENSGECNNNIDTAKVRQRRDTGRKDLPNDKVLNDSVDIYKFSEPDPDFDTCCNSIQGKKKTKTNKKEEGTKLPKNNRKIKMIDKQEDKKTKLQKTTSKNATKTGKRIIEETSSRDQADDVSVGKVRRKSLRTRDKNINYSEEDDFSKNDSTSSTDKREENSTQPVLPKNAKTPENSPAKSEVIACKLKSSLKKMKPTGIEEVQERSKSRVSFDLPNSESQDDIENTSSEQVEIKHSKFGPGDLGADNLSNTEIIQEITESLEVQNTLISDVEHNKTQLVNKSDKTAELSRSEEPHSPISEDSVNSDSLYIESDDSYNARRFKMEVGHWSKPKKKRESSVRKKERESERKSKQNPLQKEKNLSDTLSKQDLAKQENNNSISHDTSDDKKNQSCRKSNNKGKRNEKFKNIPKCSSEDSDLDDSSPKKPDLQLVSVHDCKDNEKPKNKKCKPGKQKEHDMSFSVEQSFECMEHEDGLSISQQKIKTVSEAKGKNMIFQMSYTKSQTNVKRNIGRKYGDMSVKTEPAYDPYDFEAQCDNASMASERVGRNDISKELNKKHKKSDKKMNNNRFIEYDSIRDDMDEHLPMYLDKKSKNKSTEEEKQSNRNKKLEKTRYFNDSDDNHTYSEETSKSEKGKHNTEDEITSGVNGSFGYDTLIQNYADDHSSTDIDKINKKKSKKKSDKSSYLNDFLVHDSNYPEEMSKAEVNQKTKRSRKSTPNQYCDDVDSSFSYEHSQEISIDEVKQSKTKTSENKLTSLVQDKRTNKWYRVKDKPYDIICTEDKKEKRSTKQKVNRTNEDDSIRSPSSSGEGAKEIEHNAESFNESFENYTLKNFSIILQDIVSGRGRLDKSWNISAIDQNEDTEIKTPCITGSVSSTPKIGSARRKHYNPLNISVIKTPQSARSLQSDSDAEKELKRNKQEKKKNRKKKSDNYRDHSISEEDYVEDDGCNERSSKLSIDSLSLLDSSCNETSKSEKSWILERKKTPRIKKSAKTYKTNKTVKGQENIETDSQTEESMDEEYIKQLQPNAKAVWQKDNLSLVDTPLTIPSLSVNTPAVTPSFKSVRSFQDAEDLIETPVSPKKNARKKQSDEDDIEVEQTQESYKVSLNMSCCDSDNEDDDIRSLSLSGFKMKTPQKFIQDDVEDEADDEQLSVHTMLQQNMKLLLGDSGFASGPSSTVRPSRSALKRKYPDIDETIHIESSSSSQAESDEEINTSTFVPKKLFKFDPAVPLTPQAPSLYSDDTENTELDLGFQSGLATFMAAFGADIQNQLKQRKQRIEVMTKKTLKESQKHFSQTLVEQHQYQANLIDDFEAKMVVELMALEKDIQMLAESEQKMEDYYKFQFEVLRQNEESQKKRLENLRKLQASYLDKTRRVNKYNLNIHQNLQEQLKKDMLALQKRLIIDTKKQEFMNVKRGLQNLF